MQAHSDIPNVCHEGSGHTVEPGVGDHIRGNTMARRQCKYPPDSMFRLTPSRMAPEIVNSCDGQAIPMVV